MSKKEEGAAPSVIVEAILLAVNVSKTVRKGSRQISSVEDAEGSGQSTIGLRSLLLPRRVQMTPANLLKKHVQDRGDWCECGNKSDRALRISIEQTLVSDRLQITGHHFSIWYCEDCDGIVDVITD